MQQIRQAGLATQGSRPGKPAAWQAPQQHAAPSSSAAAAFLLLLLQDKVAILEEYTYPCDM